MLNRCQKCDKLNVGWVSGETYLGLDEHHNPPEFMFKYESDSYSGTHFIKSDPWKGEIYTLCRDCHTGLKGLHRTVIIPFLFKKSGLLKKNGSEYWLWKHILPKEKIAVREEIFVLTKQWLSEKDENTGTAEKL